MSDTLKHGVTEAQTLQHDVDEACDVCVIGSGPGGAVTAEHLARAGLRVVILEEGGYFTRERFAQREADAHPYLYQDGTQRSTSDAAITILQGKAVGGGSVINWTTCFRTPDDVLDHWQQHHQCALPRKELSDAFAWAEARLSIATTPMELINANNRKLYEGAVGNGIAAAPVMRNVRGCAYTGSCGHGCPIDAKQSMLVTLLPDAFTLGASLVSRCRVKRLEQKNGAIVSVEAEALDAFGLAPTGVRIRIRPKRVVVSCGAINSPALLLRSGIGDPHARLGKRTFLHPVIACMGDYDERIEGWRGAPQSIASHAFVKRAAEVGYFLETAPVHPMLAAVAAPGLGQDHADLLARLPHLTGHLALMLDGFHDDVSGGTVKLASDGSPILDYPITERLWRGMRDAQKVLARIGFASGAKRVMTGHDPPFVMTRDGDIAGVDALPYAPNRVAVFSAHQMGGCSMSDDPRQGVVRTNDLRHHQLENLFVVDGSVFPTSLGVNPQLSIYGFAKVAATAIASSSS